jgi:hypothetical protein
MLESCYLKTVVKTGQQLDGNGCRLREILERELAIDPDLDIRKYYEGIFSGSFPLE